MMRGHNKLLDAEVACLASHWAIICIQCVLTEIEISSKSSELES